MISEGCHVVLQKVGGDHIKVCKITNGRKVRVQKLTFESSSAIGQSFGLFEVNAGKLRKISPSTISTSIDIRAETSLNEIDHDNVERSDVDVERTHLVEENSIELEKERSDPTLVSDNHSFLEENDTEDSLNTNQKMTCEEIRKMKKSGVSTKQLVEKLVEGSVSFSCRTVFSKNKYIRRKSSKHSDQILILRPTVRLIAQSFYMKDSDRIISLRLDLLSHIVTLSGVHSGSKCIVFEQSCGLISAAVIDRLGGNGSCIYFHRGLNVQGIPCVDCMDFTPQVFSTFMPLPISYLISEANLLEEEDNDSVNAIIQTTEMALRKRERLQREKTVWELLKSGKSNSLIIATKDVKPNEVLEKLWPFLDCSTSIVVYSSLNEHITLTYNWLKANNAVNVEINDAFYRSYLVLPENTRPHMQQLVTGGVILFAIKVSQMK